VADVKRFEREIQEFIGVKYNQIYENIKKEKALSDETISEIKKASEEFLTVFKKSA
jgi:F0F1-type ATP synthase alpha subunit